MKNIAIILILLSCLNFALAKNCKIVKINKKTNLVVQECDDLYGWKTYRKYYVRENKNLEVETGAISPKRNRVVFKKTFRDSQTGLIKYTTSHSKAKWEFLKQTLYRYNSNKKIKLNYPESKSELFVCHKKGSDKVECSDGHIYYQDKPAECLKDVLNNSRKDAILDVLPSQIDKVAPNSSDK